MKNSGEQELISQLGIAFSDLYPVANERNATDLIYMVPVFGVKVLFYWHSRNVTDQVDLGLNRAILIPLCCFVN